MSAVAERLGRLRDRLRQVDYDRLNHILIPSTNAERERWRKTRLGRAVQPLFWVFYALTPAGRGYALMLFPVGMFGLEIERADVYVLWSLLMAAAVVSVAARRAFAMEGVRVDVRAPARAAIDEPVNFTVELTHDGDRPHADVTVEGPFLPWDGRWEGAHPRLPVLAPGARVTLTVTGRFRSRGEHHLDPFHVGAMVPLGLTYGPLVRSRGVRFVVIPRAARVISVSMPLRPRHQPGGAPQALASGDSFELRGLRPYRSGDPVRDLHAKSWARTGVPVVREYQQEHFRRAAVVLDPDVKGQRDAAVLDAAVSLAAGLVSYLSREDALVDLVLIGARVHELHAQGGRAQEVLGAALDLLACVEPGEPFDAERVLKALGPFAPRLSAAVVVTCAPRDDHATVAGRLRALGVECKVVAIHREGAQTATPAGVTSLSHRAVLTGEPVSV